VHVYNYDNILPLIRNNYIKYYYILADDGAATDASIIAAARWIKKNNKSRNHLIMLFL
jgi:predicted phosphoribosyltransferase